MRVVVIGGTGHSGTFLVPRLVKSGYSVLNISRRSRQPYVPDGAWDRVEQIAIDRGEAEAAGAFGDQVRQLAPDVVIDLTCYTRESARQLVEGVRSRIRQFLHLGRETLHHVHADDVAQAFELSVMRPAAAIGESFHVVSPAALTVGIRRGCGILVRQRYPSAISSMGGMAALRL